MTRKNHKNRGTNGTSKDPAAKEAEGIAVIGMACRFPGARDYEEFWGNLVARVNSVGKIPKDRWDWRDYFGDPQTEPNKTSSKWGGFIEDIDKFDASFFRTSPREAEQMDPQQRILLELTWGCLENSGYKPSALAGRKVGVFIGVCHNDYKEIQENYGRSFEGYAASGTGGAILANRISYFFDFQGPSVNVDTACSSSLVSLHQAVNSINDTEIELAIAGGINYLGTATRHLALSNLGMLSSTGRCKTFDKNADGYVRGEGAGLIFLKSLKRALDDNNRIYGVIKSSCINHGGRGHTLTSPNAYAQSKLIVDAYTKANIPPNTVTYLETHGTGTPLGDPIEINGLLRAFKKLYRQFGIKKPSSAHCGLGAVKTNIGHLEGAAGIAGTIKVLLAMKYKKLPALQNFSTLNPRISLKDSPFCIVQETKEWKPLQDVEGREIPRRAGVSSFGFGGANAHVIIEEWPPPAEGADRRDEGRGARENDHQPALIVLSAKNEDRLKEIAKNLCTYIFSPLAPHPLSLHEVAYTLQVGREAMEERLALIVKDAKDLLTKLSGFIDSKQTFETIYSGNVKRNKEKASLLGDGDEGKVFVNSIIENRKLHKLAQLWCSGVEIEWDLLYADYKPLHVSLPTYPFVKERYWISEKRVQGSGFRVHRLGEGNKLHPLVHENTSNFDEQRFSSTFTGKEFFLADHRVNGQRMMPELAYLEMARVAVEQTAGSSINCRTEIRLNSIVWGEPIVVNAYAQDIKIALSPKDTEEIAFEIYTECETGNADAVIHCQGHIQLNSSVEMPVVNLPALWLALKKKGPSSEEIYKAYEDMGIVYAPGFQGIKEIFIGEGQVTAKLSLPISIFDTLDPYVLHPSLLASALQASIALNSNNQQQSNGNRYLFVPFTLESIDITGRYTASMWACIRYSNGKAAGAKVRKLDIDLYDDQGRICGKMKGLSSRLVERGVSSTETVGMLMCRPIWKEKAVAVKANSPEYLQHLVMVCEMDPLGVQESGLAENIADSVWLRLRSKEEDLAKHYQSISIQVFETIRKILDTKPKGKILIQILVPHQGKGKFLSCLSGLLKTAHLENPNILGQLIEVNPSESEEDLLKKVNENSRTPEDAHIRYQDGRRMVIAWEDVPAFQKEVSLPWKDRGVYLLTGGAGGLGLIFAKEIAGKTKNSTLILTGRSGLSQEKQDVLKRVESLGAKVEYKQVDVAEKKAVARLMQSIQKDFDSLDGIIHCAGVTKDNYILKKSKAEFTEVLRPKVMGVANLDQAAQALDLDFFVLFSSGAGVTGNVGQVDYATANAFMDLYADYRNDQVSSSQRRGHTLSIDWPLWKEGGMTIDEATEKMMKERFGLGPMETSSGINAFYQCLASKASHMVVMEGRVKRIKQRLLMDPYIDSEAKKAVTASVETISEIDTAQLADKIQHMLIRTSCALLKVKTEDLDVDAELSEYGFDSITLTEFANQLNKEHHLELMPTVFFEHPTIGSFAKYLANEHRLVFVDHFAVPTQRRGKVEKNHIEHQGDLRKSKRHSRFGKSVTLPPSESKSSESIAIVGMSGYFPMANDIDEFWGNLVEGKTCISEIPKDRWDWQAHYGNPNTEANKTDIKWGGFIDGVDEFDPLFFSISPREARLMDPQQRLLMMYVWKTIEDAGYSAESLSGSGTAIFVGTASSGYSGLISQADAAIEGFSSTGAVPSVGPNRMSYFLNLHGPSEPIETACSSSLVALHRAVVCIRNGSCDTAIAGGVNTIVTPEVHISFNKAGMLCEDGRCKTFSKQANGYVRGEGVGMLLLKKLKDAEEAGDHVYSVIRATAENHGGRANSLTAPNPKAQAELLKTAYTQAGIDPRTVRYIEAHGTGTELGDPVEINGLKTAFAELYQAKGDRQVPYAHCGLGSVKTNIGHLELAAGIAGVIKVLLQLKHKTLVKSLHCDEINPYIQLKDSPFYIVQEPQEWKALQDEQGNDLPRRAGVSSFGFGGANAHVVIEEWPPPAEGREAKDDGRWARVDDQRPALIVLSAKNEERLKEVVKNLYTYLTVNREPGLNLHEVAYTLQVGREAMDERLAMTVRSAEELREKLKNFLERRDVIDGLHRGQVKRNKDTLTFFSADEELQEALDKWIQRGKYSKLLDLWVKGVSFDWNKLYSEDKPNRISLPTYPFARERYWVEKGSRFTVHGSQLKSKLHPLVHENTSNLEEQRFSSTFTGDEYFFADHRVQGQKVLPGLAYPEMARAAVEQAAGPLSENQTGIQLKNIVWARPIVANGHAQAVHIGLFPQENGQIQYEIYTELEDGEEGSVVHSQGVATLSALEKRPPLDLPGMRTTMNQGHLSSRKCYDAFRNIGIDCGAGHRWLESVYVGKNQVLAKLSLPFSVSETQDPYILHATLMDSALQASFVLMSKNLFTKANVVTTDQQPKTVNRQLFMPLALREVEVLHRCTSTTWALIRSAEDSETEGGVQKIDIALCDDHGTICVRMKGLEIDAIETNALAKDSSVPRTICFLNKRWERCSASPPNKSLTRTIAILKTEETEGLANQLSEYFSKRYSLDVLDLASDLQQRAYDWKTICGLVDLTGCGTEKNTSLAWISWLQQLIEKGSKESLVVLCVTKGLESYQNRMMNLLGAPRVGLYRMLQSEYSHLRSRHIDVDSAAETGTLVKQIASEFCMNVEDTEICYRNGKRYRAYLQEDEPRGDPDQPLVFPKDQVLWITGGTRGLGYLCAQHFAKNYGVKRLVLTGREVMPPRDQWDTYLDQKDNMTQKIQRIRVLEKEGVEVVVLSDSLTDPHAVYQSLQKIKKTMGPIGGVIHSAGSVNTENPAFIRKSLEAFSRC